MIFCTDVLMVSQFHLCNYLISVNIVVYLIFLAVFINCLFIMEVDSTENESFTVVKTEDEEKIKPSLSGEVLFPSESRFAGIRNKEVRAQQYQKLKRERKKVIFCYFI